MSHPSPDRDERVRQIREWADGGWLVSPKPPALLTREAVDHIDYLLSLLDSQAAGDAAKERDEWKEFAGECKEGIRASHRVLDELGVPREDAWLQETDGENYGVEEVVEYPVHERIRMLPPFVATRMRDRCVAKMRRKAEGYQKDSERPDFLPGYKKQMAFAASALRESADDLQSLTHEGEQEKSK